MMMSNATWLRQYALSGGYKGGSHEFEKELTEAAALIEVQAKQIKDLKWSIDTKDREIRKLRDAANPTCQ